jgi:hypothetical protein
MGSQAGEASVWEAYWETVLVSPLDWFILLLGVLLILTQFFGLYMRFQWEVRSLRSRSRSLPHLLLVVDRVVARPRITRDGAQLDVYFQIIPRGFTRPGPRSFSDDSKLLSGNKWDDFRITHGGAESRAERDPVACLPTP